MTRVHVRSVDGELRVSPKSAITPNLRRALIKAKRVLLVFPGEVTLKEAS